MQIFHSYFLEQNKIHCQAYCSCSDHAEAMISSPQRLPLDFCPQKSENPNGTKLFPHKRFRQE